MLLTPDCSDRTARKIDKHVLSVPLTLMMGRRYFFAYVVKRLSARLRSRLWDLQLRDRWFESNHMLLPNVFLLI